MLMYKTSSPQRNGGFAHGGDFSAVGAGMQQSNLMEMMKVQLMSMMMFRSTQPGHDTSNGQSGLFTMMYSMVAIAVIERIMAFLPVMLSYLQVYLDRRWKDSQQTILDSVSALSGKKDAGDDNSAGEPKHKEIMASIRFFAKTNNADNIVCDALFDFVTNLPAVKKVLYTNKTFLINNTDSVLLDNNDEIYAQLHKVFSIEDTEESPQILDVYSYHLDIHGLRQFIEKVTANYTRKIQNKLGDNLYFFNGMPTKIPAINGVKDYSRAMPILPFSMKRFQTNRRFRNVLGAQSRLIQKRVEFFKNNKKWYDDKGIPYTLGLLLCGPPGGGKTSTIKCIANELQRHIVNISFSGDITKTQLETLFYSETINVVNNGRTESFSIPIDKRIYVIEDVDCDNNDIVMDRELLADASSAPRSQNSSLPFSATTTAGAGAGGAQVTITSPSTGFPFENVSGVTTTSDTPSDMWSAMNSNFELHGDLSVKSKLPDLASKGPSSTFSSLSILDAGITQKKPDGTLTRIGAAELEAATAAASGAILPFSEDPTGAPKAKEQDPNKLTLSCLLNLLDGVLETPGRILIMTSNYPGTLDKALIRPGRIDLITEFERCNHATVQEFIETFYDVQLTDAERQQLENETTEYMYTPAELSKILFECFESHAMAIDRLCKKAN
jgi:hypothetical protein